MALHEYELNGLRYQFDNDDVPAGAKRVDAAKPDKKPAANKAPAAQKARTPRNKAVKPAANKAPAAPASDAASDPGASE